MDSTCNCLGILRAPTRSENLLIANLGFLVTSYAGALLQRSQKVRAKRATK
jgi:hypothetical protein